MQALANSYAFWILLFVVLVVVYLLPTLFGIIRGVDRLALVFLVNLIGAPTGIGWFAAMILHLSTAGEAVRDRLADLQPPERAVRQVRRGGAAGPVRLLPG